MERSTYVLVASLTLALLFWQWQPLPAILWEVPHSGAAAVLTGLSLVGWALALYSSFLINHFDLFGLRQVFLHLRKRPYTYPPFMVRSLYRFVRHPLMVGILVGIWATPTMTVGHLLFSLLLTGYIVVGVFLKERDLARHLGPEYQRYREQIPKFLPAPVRSKAERATGPRREPGR